MRDGGWEAYIDARLDALEHEDCLDQQREEHGQLGPGEPQLGEDDE